jgi:hypothetical protein
MSISFGLGTFALAFVPRRRILVLMNSINGIWHGDDSNGQSYDDYRDDIDRAEAPIEVDEELTAQLPVRATVSVETMVAIIRGRVV